MFMHQKMPQFDGVRVLLVEDDVLLAMEMEDFLGDLGFEVVGPYGKLHESLEAAERERIDGAILDLNLRGELSFPLIEKLAADNVPVIVCSGYVDLPGMNERLAKVPCLAKPCDTNMLIELMKQHFADGGGRRPHSVMKASSQTRPVSG